MDSFHIASDAAFWPCGDDQTAIWSENPSSVPPAPVFGFDLGVDSQFTDITWNAAPSFENPASGSTTIANPEVTGTMGFSPAFTYPYVQPSNFNQMMYPDMFTPWPTPLPTPPSTNGDSVPSSSQSVASWAENMPFSSEVIAEPYTIPVPNSPTALAVPPQLEFSSFETSGQFNDTTTPYLAGGGSIVGTYTPYTDFPGAINAAIYQSWGPAELGAQFLGVADGGGTQTTSGILALPRTSLRKRPRGANKTRGDRVVETDNGQGRGRRKKAKGKMAVDGVLGAAGHTSRARKPSTRTPVKTFSDISEAAGRGAERLAVQNAQGLYHRILLGPSTQESMETTAWENLPWVEGREQGAMWQHENSVVEPQEVGSGATDGEQEEDAEGALFRIPKRLSERHSGLLNATAEDWARAFVRELKCKLCPDAGFCNWEGFKRHCGQSEAHPSKVWFCEFCGDFFARIDSLKRHRKDRPAECLSVSPDEALAKRRATEEAHREFQARLTRCLKTGEDIGDPFSQIIIDMFPDSSKRGSRQQNRLET